MKMPSSLKYSLIASGLTIAILATACGDGFRTLPVKKSDGAVDFEGSKMSTETQEKKVEVTTKVPVKTPAPPQPSPETPPPAPAPNVVTPPVVVKPPTAETPKAPVTVVTNNTPENSEATVVKDIPLKVTFTKATKMAQANREYQTLTMLNELLINGEKYAFVSFHDGKATPHQTKAPSIKEGLRLKYIAQCRDTSDEISKKSCENYYLVLSFYKVEVTKKATSEDQVDQEKETLIDQFGILQSNIFDKVVVEKLEVMVDQHAQQYDIMDNLHKLWKTKDAELRAEERKRDPVQQRMEEESPFAHGA